MGERDGVNGSAAKVLRISRQQGHANKECLLFGAERRQVMSGKLAGGSEGPVRSDRAKPEGVRRRGERQREGLFGMCLEREGVVVGGR